ncbi:hypothetical protein CBR_g78857 [Chara braunii]|uniref:Uncharacterized protein n=1 Tax=Chara braunii TaxID=69332 RepID=A0A388KAQ2_CHABU|nr:hypothetical protein CBR_g78857 [Chara braunii]|eukprot:GBG67076.1 hypothetical protein CBR_g78857 [Chara braunii]
MSEHIPASFFAAVHSEDGGQLPCAAGEASDGLEDIESDAVATVGVEADGEHGEHGDCQIRQPALHFAVPGERQCGHVGNPTAGGGHLPEDRLPPEHDGCGARLAVLNTGGDVRGILEGTTGGSEGVVDTGSVNEDADDT